MVSTTLLYAPNSHDSVIQDNSDEQIGILTAELINSDFPIRQINQVQALINAHENLQPSLQTMAHNNALMERINNHSRADLDTIVNSVDAMRSVGKICRSLSNENLSQEAVEVVNTEGLSVVNNLLNICSRTVREVQESTRILEVAIAENERTRNDSLTNELLQQQLQITTNFSTDPRQAYRQIQEVITVGDQLRNQIELVEPNENATVRPTANRNSQYLKYAASVLFLGAAAVAMCAGIASLSPIVITALRIASTAAVATLLS